MATACFASVVIPLPLATVWNAVRDFTSPAKYASTVAQCHMLDKAHSSQVGGARLISWKSGETKMQRLLELSDQYYRLAFETISTNHPAESTAEIFTIRLRRVGETNGTYVSYEVEYAADVSRDLIAYTNKALLGTLQELRSGLLAGKPQSKAGEDAAAAEKQKKRNQKKKAAKKRAAAKKAEAKKAAEKDAKKDDKKDDKKDKKDDKKKDDKKKDDKKDKKKDEKKGDKKDDKKKDKKDEKKKDEKKKDEKKKDEKKKDDKKKDAKKKVHKTQHQRAQTAKRPGFLNFVAGQEVTSLGAC